MVVFQRRLNGIAMKDILMVVVGQTEIQDFLEIEGDIILGGLFPIHKKSTTTENACGEFNDVPGYLYMEAMLFAIDKINNKEPNLLKNISLGAQIYDTCKSKTIAADRAKEFIKMTIDRGAVKGQLAGVVGALSSGVSASVANFLRVFEIPQISYASTSVTLSNKDIYSYFLRTVPPDSFQAQLMIDIIKRFGWTYVSAVNSAGEYGTKGIEIFVDLAEKEGICIDVREKLSQFPTPTEYKKVVKKLVTKAKLSNLSVVVIFGTQTDAGHLLEAASTIDDGKRLTWIGSDDWSDYFDGTAKWEEVAHGSFGITFRSGGVLKEFHDYFINLKWTNETKNNRYFQEFWQHRLKCQPEGIVYKDHVTYNNSCRGDESLKKIELSPVRVVIDAVYAFAHALNDLQKELCAGEVGMCAAMSRFQRSRLLEHLKNVSFQDETLNVTVKFNEKGDVNAMYDIVNLQKRNNSYKFVTVGSWDGELKGNVTKKTFVMEDEKIEWLESSSTAPESFCTKDCKNNEIRKPKANFNFKCCWDCMACNKLQIIVNNSCHNGPEGWVPNMDRSGWIKRQVIYLVWTDTWSIVLLALASLSILLALITLLIYIVKRDHRIVKASGKELCYVILAGIGLCFLTPFLYVATPTDPLCYIRNLVSGIALAMCYAPLFMKINRIYRIFTSARSSVARPPFVTPRIQLLVTFGLVTIQLMFTTLWFIAKPVHAVEKYYSGREEIVLQCSIDKLSFSVNLCYVIVLMALCTAYAFKTRNFPKNFNESKYIGITMYVTCSIWVLFFPFYLNTDYSIVHSYLISGACVVVGLITLIGLFAQKIYIIYFVREIQNEDLVLTSRSSKRRSEIDQRMRRMSEMVNDAVLETS